MVAIRLISFVFMLMFTLLEARDLSYKHNYQGIFDTKLNQQSNEFVGRSTQPIVAKEITSHVIQTKEEGSDMKLEGRKLATKGHGSTKAKAIEGGAKGWIDGRSSEMSGRMTSASRAPKSQATSKQDENNSMGKTVDMTSVSNAKQHRSEKRGISDDPSFQKLDSHDLEAANEVWTLMNKDYPGNGKAHHNPPINNR